MIISSFYTPTTKELVHLHGAPRRLFGANPFACIAAGIASLWGPAHVGANEACLRMFEEINKVEHIPAFIKRITDKNDSFRLMGFGHRVYKNDDPRATVMRKTCYEVLKELKLSDDLLG